MADLTGTHEAIMTDLNSLTAQGVRIVGRLGRIIDGLAQFSGSLPNTCALADLKMNRFLNRADEWAATSGLDGELPSRVHHTDAYFHAVDPSRQTILSWVR